MSDRGSSPALTPAQRALASSPAALASADRLARTFERRYAGLVSIDDLLGAGGLGLARAARTYDASLGVEFETYAWSRVHGAMMDTVRGEVRHGHAARAGAYRLADTIRDELDPWNDGDAEHRARLEAFSDAFLMGMLLGLVSDSSQASARGPEGAISAREEHARAVHALGLAVAGLREPDPALIRLLYDEERSLRDAGAALGLSYATVRRLHQRVLERLAARLRAAGVRGSPDAIR